jgi:flagellar export protein FliJ
LKKFKFRLESVQKVRQLEEERARMRLMEANAEARETAARVEARLHAYVSSPRPDQPLSREAFEHERFKLEALATAVESARIAHREALDVVDVRRVEWLEAKQRVSALEKLEARRREEHAIDLRRAEDRLIDDLVVARHRLRNNQGVGQ